MTHFSLLVAIFILITLDVSSSRLHRQQLHWRMSTTKLSATSTVLPITKVTVPVVTSSTGFDISISERTTTCLDFAFVLECLRNVTVTVLGAELATQREAQNVDEANMGYARVDELFPHIGFIPLRTSMNVWPILRAIEMNTSPPEREDLASFAENVESLDEVREYFKSNRQQLSLFDDMVAQLLLPDDLTATFKGSFDDDSNLNAEKYPELGKLRQKAEVLRGRIIQTLQTLLRSQDMKEKVVYNITFILSMHSNTLSQYFYMFLTHSLFTHNDLAAYGLPSSVSTTKKLSDK